MKQETRLLLAFLFRMTLPHFQVLKGAFFKRNYQKNFFFSVKNFLKIWSEIYFPKKENYKTTYPKHPAP